MPPYVYLAAFGVVSSMLIFGWALSRDGAERTLVWLSCDELVSR